MAYYIQIQKENEIIIKKLYIEEKSSIEDLKFEIKKILKIPNNEQFLFYKEFELNDDKKNLKDYEIKKSDIIILKNSNNNNNTNNNKSSNNNNDNINNNISFNNINNNKVFNNNSFNNINNNNNKFKNNSNNNNNNNNNFFNNNSNNNINSNNNNNRINNNSNNNKNININNSNNNNSNKIINNNNNITIKIKNQYFNENNEEVKKFHLLPTKTIFDLKNEIEKELKIEIHNQKIEIENNIELKNEEKINNFSSKILFLKHFKEKIIILINKEEGKLNFQFNDFNENNVILDIKKKIFEYYKIPIQNQILFYENEEKNNDFSLINIQNKLILFEFEELIEITILNYSKIFKVKKGINILKLKYLIEEKLKIPFHSIKILDEDFKDEIKNEEKLEKNNRFNIKIICDLIIIDLIHNNEFLIKIENEKNIDYLIKKIKEEQKIEEDFYVYFNNRKLYNLEIIDNIIDNNYLKAHYFQII